MGAFDNVEWYDILMQLLLNCPANVAGVIQSYLSERSIVVNWGPGFFKHGQKKGCPQGSCLGPILWLIIANLILVELSKLGFLVFAFADDFCIILRGLRRIDLEREAREVFDALIKILQSLGLSQVINQRYSDLLLRATMILKRDTQLTK